MDIILLLIPAAIALAAKGALGGPGPGEIASR